MFCGPTHCICDKFVYFLFTVLFLVVSSSAVDCLESLISEMIWCVLSGMLNIACSLTMASLLYSRL